MNAVAVPGVDSTRLAALVAQERQRFVDSHPKSFALATRSHAHWLNGVPMHWMRDWGTAFPLFVESAAGATLRDADGHEYVDFCLGDTGAMFGHSPPPVASAIARQAARGLTAMLPATAVADVGESLTHVFGLPFWQIAQTATDANRYALRWCRAITGRTKVLAFQGCYHGTLDETLVRLVGERTVARPGLIGPAFDNSVATTLVEFNDVAALERALAMREYACVIAEPVMTNIGMVPAAPGFHDALRAATRRTETLLLIDETHTLSTGYGGYTRVHGLQPDLWVCGKAIAGGLPCAVFGFSAQVEARMRAVLAARDGGHSGMGTTLAANPLAIAALDAALRDVITDANYSRMLAVADRLEQSLRSLFVQLRLPWHVARVGARLEFGFGPRAPRNGTESEAAMRPDLEQALHLYWLNRGVLLTPFHNMMLCSPVTPMAAVDRLVATLAEALAELRVAA